jgi:2',3'-cyclic-nucleotide 2'-phosphodiesterase (5'-nucleotidase family)
MQRSFSYILLITWFFLFLNCKNQYVISTTENKNLVVSDSVTPLDSQIVSLYLPYKNMLEKDMSRIIAVTKEEMVKDKPESNLTNFLADLILAEGNKIATELGENIRPSISYYNYGGIRTFLPEGEITVGKIFELMPFENELVFLELSGTQVQEFLNIIAEKGGDSLGGVRFKISENKAKNVEVAGKSLNEKEHYWLVTNDYIAAGGDGLDVFTRSKNLVSGNIKIRDVIIDHLEKKYGKNQEILAQPDGRISHE